VLSLAAPASAGTSAANRPFASFGLNAHLQATSINILTPMSDLPGGNPSAPSQSNIVIDSGWNQLRVEKPKNKERIHMQGMTIHESGKGQGNGGGWPSTTGNPSGGGRSNGTRGGK
jgi:hypothetical protein